MANKAMTAAKQITSRVAVPVCTLRGGGSRAATVNGSPGDRARDDGDATRAAS